jgi:hypothetical protein
VNIALIGKSDMLHIHIAQRQARATSVPSLRKGATMKWINADYIKELMKNDRLMQGNAEFNLYAQQVEMQVNATPSIDIVFCKECKYRKTCCRSCYKSNYSYCSDGEREGE